MRRKGVPCACDPCKGKNYVRAVNNVSPDPNGDLTIRGGQGIKIIQSGDDIVINNTANPNAFVAGNNIELNPSGDDISIDLTDEPVVDGLTINGDLEVNGDIIQNGSAYETHAEQIYTRDDYIIMRDGAVAGLPQGDFSGLQVKLYDGMNDGRLVIDNDGTARVGDVGDEQPLLTRDEAADLTDGHLLEWDGANSKAVDSNTLPAGQLFIGTGINAFVLPSGRTAVPFTTDSIDSDYYTVTNISNSNFVKIKKKGTYIINGVIDCIVPTVSNDIVGFISVNNNPVTLTRGSTDTNPYKSVNMTILTTLDVDDEVSIQGQTDGATTSTWTKMQILHIA